MSPDRGLDIASLLSEPIQTIPRTSLESPALHDHALKQLLASARRLVKAEVWSEAALLERLHYKNKNQHRRALYFTRFKELRRLLGKLKALRTGDVLNALAASMRPPGAKRGDWIWDRTPHQDYIARFIALLRHSTALITKLRISCAQTYVAFKQLFAATLFMPFALVVMGCCARIAALCRPWMVETRTCAEELSVWARTLPLSSPDAVGVDHLVVEEEMDEMLAENLYEAPEMDLGIEQVEDETGAELPDSFVDKANEAMELSKSFFDSITADSVAREEAEDMVEETEAAEPVKPKKKKKKKKARVVAENDEIDAIFNF